MFSYGRGTPVESISRSTDAPDAHDVQGYLALKKTPIPKTPIPHPPGSCARCRDLQVGMGKSWF